MRSPHTDSAPRHILGRFILAEHPTSGTVDDDDDPGDEHEGENEAPVRETDENTEAPEEFEIDDEDDLGHPEDDDADAE